MARPSVLMRGGLDGRMPPSEAPQEWLSFILYKYADEVLKGSTRDARRHRLGQVPLGLRALVEEEAKLLWNNRRSV